MTVDEAVMTLLRKIRSNRLCCTVKKRKMYSKLMVNNDYLLAFAYAALKIKLLYFIIQMKNNIAISYEQYFMTSCMSVFEESHAIIRVKHTFSTHHTQE